MKFYDRQIVEGTEPTAYIGHRVSRKSDGEQQVSALWYAEYCHENRQRFEALKTTNKAVAIRKAHEICARIRAGQPEQPRLRTTVKDVVDTYVELIRAQGRAPTTITKYELVGRNVIAWCGNDGLRRVASLTEADFWSLRKFLIENEEVCEKTAYDRLYVVKQMLKSAVKRRLISVNPFAGISMTNPESAQQPCFTPEQVAMLLAKADAHLKPILATLAYAGLRFGEVRDLIWSDLALGDDNPGFIVVRRGGSSGKTKSKRLRRVPINPALREILDGHARQFDRVFTALPSTKHPTGGGALNERRCLLALKRLCKRCGFANPTRYKLHTLRHTFASMCARNNVSHKYALEWMGHRSSDILDLYYTMFDADAHAAMRTLIYPNAPPPSSTFTSEAIRSSANATKADRENCG